MKSLISGIIFYYLLAFSTSAESPVFVHRFVVLPQSTLTIEGKTNVSSFQCLVTHYTGTDTLVLQEGGRLQKPVFTKGTVSISTALFDCGLQMITNDFRQTILYPQHPALQIEFRTFEKVPGQQAKDRKYKGTMAISLAGVSKEFSLACTIQPRSPGVIHVSGSRKFSFSDFNLVPPKKMMGMIKIEDEISVRFNLVLQPDTH
jgi:hypothetical protein